MADGHCNNNHVPVLFSYSVFSRPSSVPVGSGHELLIQKFLSIYGYQIDVHRKFVIQLFSEEWGQYIDLPKGFSVSEKCKLRLVPLQMDVRHFYLSSVSCMFWHCRRLTSLFCRTFRYRNHCHWHVLKTERSISCKRQLLPVTVLV